MSLRRELLTGAYVDVPEGTDPMGKQYAAPEGNVPVSFAGAQSEMTNAEYQGYKAEHPDDFAPGSESERFAKRGQAELDRQHDTFGSRAKSLVGGGAGALSFGLWKPFQDDQQYHPNYAIAGNIATTLPLLFTGEGEAELAGEGAEALSTGDRLKAAYNTFTAPGISGHISRLAERLVPDTIAGSKALGSVAKTAVGGAAYGVSDEAGRQLLDSDHEFSGEALLSAGALGGVIGGAGSAAAEGLGRLGTLGEYLRGGAKAAGRDAEATDEAAQSLLHPVPEHGSDLGASHFDLTGGPEDLKSDDLIAQHLKDVKRVNDLAEEYTKQPEALKAAGIDPAEIQARVAPSSFLESDLADLRRGTADPEQLAIRLHKADELGQLLSRATDRVPESFTDPAARSKFWRSVGEIDPAASSGEQATQRVWARLSSTADDVGVEAAKPGILARGIRGLVDKTPLKYLSGGSGAAKAIGVTLGVEHLLRGTAGSLLGAGAHGIAGMLAAKGVSAVMKAAFRNPEIGGIIAGSAAQVLRGSHVMPGDRVAATTDPRRALRDFGDRTRRIQASSVASHAVAALGAAAGASPLSVAHAGQVASARHQYITDLLDRLDPVPRSVGEMLNRPLPSARAAHEVADALRGSSTPLNVSVAAMAGRLTPAMLRAGLAVFPASNGRLRQHLATGVGAMGNPQTSISATHRRTVETLLGPVLGGRPGSAAYHTAMQASIQRGKAAQPPPKSSTPQAPSGPVTSSPYATSAMKAANPAQGK